MKEAVTVPKVLQQQRPRLTQFGVGLQRLLLALVLILAISELIARVLDPVHETRQLSSSGSLYRRQERVGYRLYPQIESKVQLIEGSRSVFAVTYRTDEFGRRTHLPPGSPPIMRPRFLSIFGASTAFGMGLEDEETLAYFLHSQAQRYEVFNYAADGYGPQSAFALVESKTLQKEVSQDRGLAVYVLQLLPGVGGHAQTMSAGFELTMARWGESLTFYDIDRDGRPRLLGTLREVSPVRFYLFRFLQNFQVLNKLWPYLKPEQPEQDRKLAHMLRAWGDEVRENKPMSHAVILIHPFSDPQLSARFIEVWNAMPRSRVALLDYSNRLSEEQRQGYTAFKKYLAHPNAELNRTLANWMIEDLNLEGRVP